MEFKEMANVDLLENSVKKNISLLQCSILLLIVFKSA